MNIFTDVLIVGSGIAGLYNALMLDDSLDITIITKSKAHECNTYLAQGGISTALNEQDIPLFIEDTLKAGCYKNNTKAVKILAEESMENIKTILDFGCKLDRNKNGLDYTIEGAHSVERIVHCNVHTGSEVFDVLYSKLGNKQNIHLIEDINLIDIITEGNKCCGGVVKSNNKVCNIYSKATVLACGGIGGLFKKSTNQRILKGDGLAIALRNNVKVNNIQYIQFHPTALYDKKISERKFLISESLRGEGAYLVNTNNERFVDELEPRNVVAEAINKEIQRTGKEYVYLDASHMEKEFVQKRFKKIYDECLKRGIDITKDKIPVAPAQHYHMGGIDVDTCSKTSMDNLYACGEVSCTGVHGANRLASNSLLEGLVFSKRAANHINSIINNIQLTIKERNVAVKEALKIIEENKQTVKDLIMNQRGDLRNELV